MLPCVCSARRAFSLFPLCFLLCAVLAAVPASPAVQADSPKHSLVAQTFEPARNNGPPLVQVRFSGTLIGTFIVDTGENAMVIGLHPVTLVQPPKSIWTL